MKGAGGDAYCKEVLAWVEQAPAETMFVDLARYLHTRVIRDCDRVFGPGANDAPDAWTTEGAFRLYVTGALLVDDNQGAKAVPALSELLRAQVSL
ncbi:hypothetical protein [Myxococcus landrumensis]|uniref:Uncharacterized protein n=1 Tax=Myxococcus landrumensis TaxID=2813577 RepID=A0ABX7N4T1_9BACT|nr:hypothetical protein [Myxococcus landrumus]QSQ13725.1 hypothetical protein JY572_36250 [Myxococcus landrumus]